MRKLIFLVLLVFAVIAAAWLSGESWLAREAARRINDDPGMSVGTVTPMRDIRRFGLMLTDVKVDSPEGALDLPSLNIFAAPTAPNEFHATLPASMTVPVAGQPVALDSTDARLALRIAPTSGFAVSRAAFVSGPMALDGTALAQAVDLDARLTAMGTGAPRAAQASYSVAAKLDGLALAATKLPGALSDAVGPLSVDGIARLFLTGAVIPGAAQQPKLVGLSSDGVTLTAGEACLDHVGARPDGIAERRLEEWRAACDDLGAVVMRNKRLA